MDLSVAIGALTLPNPLIAASGCFGYGVEYSDIVDLATLGGVAVKGLFLAEREGHPPPRIVETPAGMLNAIGLQGIGVHRFVREKLPELRDRRAIVFVNICGTTIDEYCEIARILSDHEGVAAIELNISCPNIKQGGITFGCSLTGTHDVVSAVRKVTPLPVIPKLTPNVTDVASFARAAEEAGADAVSLVNTFLAMAIDVHTRRPKLTNIVGGLSGPAIRPIAVRMVYECRQAVKLPIIGMGGIATADDVLEFMIAGATAVQIGTANFVDPFIWKTLLSGIRDYMAQHGISRLADAHRQHRHDAERDGVDQLLIALDVETAAKAIGARRLAARGGWRVQDWQPALHLGRSRDRARARRPWRPRLSRSQVPRHPQHRGHRGIGGDGARRLDGERPCIGRDADDAGGARCGTRDGGEDRRARAPGHCRHRAHEHERRDARGNGCRRLPCWTRCSGSPSWRTAPAWTGSSPRRRKQPRFGSGSGLAFRS